ncbi:MAG: hypothetical protein UX19_C0001G0019 [Candidatus Woesebacteria bacterium GW2011_GWA1_45_8]|uniref:Uncharacterized protein n=1 Tax=Candidatus Woesebacteria bacterium GW2011_GWA1_45_8 TaxID=1618559 RepID=A0A0G1QUR8_9BACT|nr:MAG: hypothetical protein UX19_C0001G0019 [Candidatus Woesebacteria bacterium GW2011_GWA1_45_8]
MGVENLFPGLKIPVLARRKQSSLEGSFNHAYRVFDTLPITCPHIGNKDFSCGRSGVRLPDSLSGVLGVNGNGGAVGEVFVSAHLANNELERQALILVQTRGKSVVFRVEGASKIKIEESIEEVDGEETNGKIVTNFRDIFLDRENVQSSRVEPGSAEYAAFKDLLPLAKAIRENPTELLCDGCAAKKYGLPRSVV